MNTKTHTDIKRFDWIESLPEAVRPFLYLARLDRPIGIWLLLLPGLWTIVLAAGGLISLNMHDWVLVAQFCLGAVIMRAAGCVINDLWDRKLDKKVMRTSQRPLATGEVTVPAALAFLLLLLLGGLDILSRMNITTILLGIMVMPLVAVYPLMKRVTWWPQAFLGITFNFGALMGWAAVSGILAFPALLIYAGAILWTLGYDTIYAHQDMEDDALVGIRSTALKLGARSKDWVRGFYIGALTLIAIGAAYAGSPVTVALVLLAGIHLVVQLAKWDPQDSESSLEVFKSNRNFGLLILFAMFF